MTANIDRLGRTLITGTARNDTLHGTDRNDLIKGLGGDDSLSGGSGHDRLVGGGGDDTLIGYGDGDTLLGGGGADFLRGGAGDLLNGGAGIDTFFLDLSGDAASETLFLGKQAKGKVAEFSNGLRLVYVETGDLHLGAGNDVIDIGKLQIDVFGGDGDDYLINRGSSLVELQGGEGNDTIVGGRGLDWVFGGPGDDVLDGRGGRDLLDYTDARTGVTVDLRLTGPQDTGGAGVDTISGFEILRGTYQSDLLIGSDGDDVIEGKGGMDTLVGGGGDDQLSVAWMNGPWGGSATTLIGGAGADGMSGGDDADTFVYEALSDSTNEHPDLITSVGLYGVEDVIDLSAIDADITKPGDQAFQRVAAFSGQAGELVMDYDAAEAVTRVTVDVDGDACADMTIRIGLDQTAFDGFVL